MLGVVVGERYGMQSSCGPALMPALFVVVATAVRLLTQEVYPFPSVQIPIIITNFTFSFWNFLQ